MRRSTVAVALLVCFQCALGASASVQQAPALPPIETRLLGALALRQLPLAPANLEVVSATLPSGQSTDLTAGNGAMLVIVEHGKLTVLQAGASPVAVATGQQWDIESDQGVRFRNDDPQPALLLIVSLTARST